ncbi:oxidoreductase domain protein [Pirellula staleyi DSM 6068]|uniref:Oxidoreductase domain protein n=1 Tax=Pirellula staleyi (strain ATCC 27377 / DSM 6068 / ICPB 4128) TaxID=530564 RepID=D2R5Q8_PIRSD|nr:Gfo/Idh/MocA family oxidoreductase [Pirellula staleyi]ADB17240.1 oxidoreductase domain protein [Pirellula staleyi DSM 6068]
MPRSLPKVLPGSLHSTRRQFLGGCIAAGAAMAMPIPMVHSQETQRGPSDKLRLAIIGCGGRGGANLGGVSGEEIYALCDTHPASLAGAKKSYPNAVAVSDWRKLIDDPKIDGYVVSTADHHHALVSLAAMKRGKHVYCEKPLSHTVREARLMQEVYRENRGKIATQMGTQIHATDNYRRAVELVQSGMIGAISEAHVWCDRGISKVNPVELPEQPIPEGFDWEAWIGPAAMRPYNGGYWQGGNLNWNRRWEFGNGVLGDMGSHLIDLAYWALDLRYPTSVESVGAPVDEFECPTWQQVTWEHPKREGDAPHHAACKLVWYHGDEGMKRRAAYLQPMIGDDTNLGGWGIGVAFVGEQGVIVADYGKIVVSPGAKFKDAPRPEPTIAPSLGHYNEWLHAAKTGGESLCNFDYSGMLIEHNLLGVVAHRIGKKLEWDAAAFQFTGNAEANALLTKTYRDGWKPEGV